MASSAPRKGPEAAVGQPSLFSGTIADSAWTVAAFVTLVLVLTKVAWKPLLNGLNARQGHIEQQLRTAEDSRQKAEKMLEDYRQQGQTVVRQATERGPAAPPADPRNRPAKKSWRCGAAPMRRSKARGRPPWKSCGGRRARSFLRVGSEVLGRTLTPQDNQRLVDEAVTQVKRSGGL